MLQFEFKYNSDHFGNLDSKIRAAIAAKLLYLTDMMYNKVMENVEGKILQKRTGQLAESIHKATRTSDNPMVGEVFVDPATPKAWALERGGERYYPIVPVKARMLHFFAKDGTEIFTDFVDHPPSKDFRYLSTALEEMSPIISQEMQQAIEEVWWKR
jgi:hypothetical protein